MAIIRAREGGSAAQSLSCRFTPAEYERIYRRMILAELRDGPLSFIRRAHLLQYAAKFNLPRAEAIRILSETCQQHEAQRDNASEEPATPPVAAGSGVLHPGLLLGMLVLLAGLARFVYGLWAGGL